MTTAAEIKAALGLVPLPHEGGWWAQTHLDAVSSAIYYLLEAGEHSKLHRLDSREIYHYYAGAPLDLLVVHPGGGVECVLLGNDLDAGHRPQFTVPTGCWQGSSSTGEWTLVGTTMAPPFHADGCEFVTPRTVETLANAHDEFGERLRQLA